MSYQPLHHKYRPQTFGELVGQDAIAKTLSNAIASGRIAPAYLFTGPRGTGKTSSSRILAKSLNCLNSDTPTATPCGQCEACQQITRGNEMDVIEIDAASNTGVDNIREIIEKAQFAPVRCRYKVYVIDECLTGDSLIQTDQGLIPIGNSEIKGKKVLSYNETKGSWEYKKVTRWLNQGIKETLLIQTANGTIRCTHNHLIRTETGWLKAKEIKTGFNIFSPASIPDKNTRKENKSTHLSKVQSVHPVGRERVYDIEVEENHNFVANGLLVHNCHMLSVPAFNALLKTLEEPPTRVVFVLATTDPQRVLTTIISRCQRFDFRRIPLESMVNHLTEIAQKEAIDIQPDALTLVAQIANGGLRDAESLLDQLSLHPTTITVDEIWDLVGAVPERDLLKLLQTLRENNPQEVITQCRKLLDRGREPLIVLQNLAGFYLNLLIAKTAPQRNDLIAVTEPTWEALCAEAKLWDIPLILHGQKTLKESEVQIKNTTQPRLWLEVTLLGLLPGAMTVQLVPQNAPPAPKTPPPPKHASPPPQPTPREQAAPPPKPAPQAPSTPPPPPKSPVNASAPPQSPEEVLERRIQDSWQRVLQAIEPMSTRVLVQQQCTLVNFDIDDAIAYIGVPSEPLLKMAEPRAGAIEAAFEKIWHQKIKVRLQVNSGKKNSLNSPTPTKPPEKPKPPPPPQAKPTPPPPPPPPRVQSPATVEPTPQPVSDPPPGSESPLESVEDRDIDALQEIAQKLAEFFEGEVID